MSKEKAKAYEAIARGLLKAAGGLLNKRFQVSDDDESWLPDEDDEAMIPPPVGRLAARRVPIGDGQDLTDLEDIGMAAVGLVAWAGKGAVAMWEARRARRRARHPLQQAGTVVFQDDGQDQEDQQP